MKAKKLFLVPALIGVLNLLSAGQAPAQTFTSLGDINGSFDSPNFLGNTVYASLHGLVSSGNVFYGTFNGSDGGGGSGNVYVVNSDGTGLTSLYNFSEVIGVGYGPRRNADGARPLAGVILSGNTLYGTTSLGGSEGNGTIFKLSTNGTGFTVLQNGGSQAGLILSDSTLYGTADYGGTSSAGSVFALNTNGTGFSILHSFTTTSQPGQWSSTNANSGGASPAAELILAGNTLYGTAYYGGAGGAGTVFAVNRDGTGFRVLHNFTALSEGYFGTNSGGAYPAAGLILSRNMLYGTATQGGGSGSGTVFKVSTNGTDFTNLHSFTGGSDGGSPKHALVLSGNTLYGTTSLGGSLGQGTVFSLSLQPQLIIVRSGTSVILSWPTNASGFTLQSSTNLNSPILWSADLPAPSIVNGQYTVTNSPTDTQRFYRLSQ